MSYSKAITQNDLMNILNEVLPVVEHTAQIGEIIAFAGSTAPNGWLLCDGSAVSRSTYSELFAVIGTTYGSGDGSTTFNLPDLRDRFPVGAGNTYSLNSKGGEATHTLTIDEMPSHTHNGMYSSGTGTNAGIAGVATNHWYSSGYLENTGGGQAHENRPPYIGVNFIIYAGTDIPPFTPEQTIHISTSDPTSADGNNGDVWLKYTT